MKVIKEQDFDFSLIRGTSFSGCIQTTYNQLVEVLGEPTCPDPSGDDKIQKEWVVKYKGNYFTIYDWKTYDVNYTMNELTEFHIGSKASMIDNYDFIDKLEVKLNI